MNRSAAVVEELRDLIGRHTSPGGLRAARPTGFAALDGLLPGGGATPGTLIELLDDDRLAGAMTLAAILTRAAGPLRRRIVVLDPDGSFHPPTAAAWGWSADQMLIIRETRERAQIWAAVQALQSPAVAGVWLPRATLAPHEARRLRLAAEEGGSLGVVFRPVACRGQPSWADVQLYLAPRPGHRVRVEMTRCRGGLPRPAVEVPLNDDCWTGAEEVRLPEVHPLAGTTSLGRTTPSASRAARRPRGRRSAW
jgi:hypothetical protein